ncbi:MAG: hypothetical protein HZB37_09840 [Planctomycetes bacterium]|nr:hypothetical protein [Planctomycetota bacterium]
MNCLIGNLFGLGYSSISGRVTIVKSKISKEDETAYLLKSSANRERLLKAIENAAHERNLITVKFDELQ